MSSILVMQDTLCSQYSNDNTFSETEFEFDYPCSNQDNMSIEPATLSTHIMRSYHKNEDNFLVNVCLPFKNTDIIGNKSFFFEIECIKGGFMLSKQNLKEIILNQIDWDGYTISFYQPVNVIISKNKGLYYADAQVININALGETEQEALDSLYDELLFLWQDYAMEEDENMTQDAIELKQKVLKVIKEVK